MATHNDGGFFSATAGEALAAHRLVRFDASANLVYCDDEEEPLGSTLYAAASGATASIKLMTAPGTHKLTCSAAVTFAVTSDERGTPLYCDNDGKVSNTGTNQKFVAFQSGAGDGSIIEAMAVFNKFNTA